MRCEVSENLKILAHGSSIGFSNEKSASVYECGWIQLSEKPAFRKLACLAGQMRSNIPKASRLPLVLIAMNRAFPRKRRMFRLAV